MSKSQYTAPALEKGLEILEFLATCEEPQPMPAIARALDRSRNEIFRMVYVLEQKGYITRTASNDAYSLSNRLFELAMSQVPISNLTLAAHPLMQALSEKIFQSVQLVVPSGDQIVVIGRIESPGDMGFSVRIGYRRPILRSSSGIVLCAFAAPEVRSAMLDKLRQNGSEEEVSAFVEEVEKAARRGHVCHPSALVDGIIDVGAPIFGADHSRPIASLTVPFVSGKDMRVHLDGAAELLVATASEISSVLQGKIKR